MQHFHNLGKNMDNNFVEKRKHPRNEMFLVMEVHTGERASQKLNVITNNVSAGGVYFKTPYGDKFKAGMDMAFTIFLSSPTQGGKTHSSRIAGSGRIVREDLLVGDSDEYSGSSWKGVAMQFDRALKMI